jgi:hypothetical protein
MAKAKPIPTPEPEENLSDDQQLAVFISQFYADPLGFVKACFPWGEGGLKDAIGPEPWQEEFLRDIGKAVTERKFDGVNPVNPLRFAVSSGRGIGKSTMAAWLSCWIMSTRPFCKISVTANTGVQLNTKTFAAIKTWMARCITAHMFEIGSDRIRAISDPSNWMCSAITYNKDTIEGFAGQHAADSSSVYIVDEASAIDDELFVTMEGGLTRGEPMIFLFGNCTRNSGKFFRVNHGDVDEQARWNTRAIDSRSCIYTNLTEIQEMVAAEGEDSDMVRVHVRGLPPRASDTQFIPSDIIRDAMSREVTPLEDEPLVVGVDISRGGEDYTVIRFRRGADAKAIAPIRISGELSRDSMRTVAMLTDILGREHGGRKVHTMFIDATGVGGPIYDRLRELGWKNVVGVQFGGKSPGPATANMRAYIWYQMREWLKSGAIGKDRELESQLSQPGYTHNNQSMILLESKENMKKRGVGSPDDADALAVTFAQTVVKRASNNHNAAKTEKIRSLRRQSEHSWMM